MAGSRLMRQRLRGEDEGVWERGGPESMMLVLLMGLL